MVEAAGKNTKSSKVLIPAGFVLLTTLFIDNSVNKTKPVGIKTLPVVFFQPHPLIGQGWILTDLRTQVVAQRASNFR